MTVGNESENQRGTVSRRSVLKGVGAAGVVAAAAVAGVTPAGAKSAESVSPASVPLPPWVARPPLLNRPNFLVVIVDEQRFPPGYESDALKAWREANLPAQAMLRAEGLELLDHHIMAAACAPSRTSFLTGQYPSLHGVSQTSGIAKSAIEEDLYWLDPTTVPTMGDWFRAGGYDTFYKGKWHVSDADLYEPGTHTAYPSYNLTTGARDMAAEQIYLDAGLLEKFGFTGWVGPEPHGANPNNSASSGPNGSGRDAVYSAQGSTQLEALKTWQKPWVLVTSFVNPHDIVLWGQLSLAQGQLYLQQQLDGSNVPEDLFKDADFLRSFEDDLSKKPDAQASYRDTYPKALQPTLNNSAYRRFYYQLQKEVDAEIKKVLDTLVSDNTTHQNTIVVYFSDHGELLGAHGGLHQKWHVSYDEVIKVPFIFHNPTLFPTPTTTAVPTSHVDLLPTMLGLAGLNQAALKADLSTTFTQVKPLPGRDLSAMVLGETSWSTIAHEPQFFMTDDEPMRGAQQIAWNGKMYPAVAEPCHLETVIAHLPTGLAGAMQRWKYTRYFDNPAFWTTPAPTPRDVATIVNGNTLLPGPKTAETTVKTTPEPDQLEIYNTSVDPLELENIAADRVLMATERIHGIVAQLVTLLDQQKAQKRLSPNAVVPSSATTGMFRFGTGSDDAPADVTPEDQTAPVVPVFTG
ncbi:MAG: sulfatase-like hydrolase/transferase [Actinomycetota bacterium]